MKKPKLIYIFPSRSSFIQSDIDFLSKKYDVILHKNGKKDRDWNSKLGLVDNLVTQFAFLLVHNIFGVKAIVISFAGYFSLLPVLIGKLFGKKTFIILNGTDCVSFPKYNYGSLRKPLLRFFVEKSQQYATKLLPVDASLIRQKHTFDDAVEHKNQGFQAFFKSVLTPVKVIPNGFDTNFWNYSENTTKTKDFITVVSANKKSTAIFKGIDLIVEVAKKYTQKTFTIIGMSEEVQQEFEASENVRFYPFVPKEKLLELYQEHQFYFQLSINEGFGCALAEAMLCGCIPIVSNAGALPNVAGENAFVVEKRTTLDVQEVVSEVLNLSEEDKKELAKKSRNHIVTNFDISKREELLLQEINR